MSFVSVFYQSIKWTRKIMC